MFAVARASAASSKAGLARSNLLTPRFFYAAAATTASPALVLGLRPVLRPYSTQTTTTTTTTTTTAPPSTNEKAAPATDAAKAAAAANPTPESKEVTPELKDTGVAAVKKEKPSGPLLKRAWAVVKKEAAHYWAGTKLLGSEIKISSKLQWKVLNGGSLTRRERRQLRRTTTDLLRLLPFSVFVIIPFMELLLPVALKLFPNMLPSTFEGQLAKDEKERKLLRIRIEMAKFLQETVKDSGLKSDRVLESDEFKQFFRKVRTTGENPSPEDVIRVAKLFNNDITLDNLTRPQLVSMCKYMNIHAFGTDNFLKHQINNRLEKIRVDDMMIHAEGIDSLSIPEITSACQSRGIRVTGVSPARLRDELAQWVDLHYTNGISGVLLILSRAFNFENKGEDVMTSLVTTLGSLPDPLIDEAELSVADEKDYKQKLTVLEQQQELIDDEAEQEQEEREARNAKRAAQEAAEAEKEKEKALQAAAADAHAATSDAKIASEASALATDATGAHPAAAQSGTAHPGASVAAQPPTPEKPTVEDAKMTKEQIGELAEALSLFTAKSSIEKERHELKEILEDNLLSEAESKEHPEEVDAKVIAVSKKVRSMIKKIDAQLEKYDERVGNSLNLIHTNARGEIFVHDLQAALRAIKHAPPEELVESLSKKLDPDGDGLVPLDHVLELASHDDGLGLGVFLDDEASNLLKKGDEFRHSTDVKDVKSLGKDLKPNRKDIIQEE